MAGVQQSRFVQALAPEAARQRRSLTSRDVRSPGSLRKLHETRGASSPQPCYITISGAVPMKKGKKARQRSLGKKAEVSRNNSEFWRWVFSTRGAVAVSISRERSLNSHLAATTRRGIDDAGCTLVFQSINSILFLLYDLPTGAVVRTRNDEYYHPGDIPDNSFLIVL